MAGSINMNADSITNLTDPTRPQDAATKNYVDSKASAVANGAVAGTGNYVAKFTGANSIGNSLIFDNGTNVGIGTIIPTVALDVNGDIHASGVLHSGNSIIIDGTATPRTITGDLTTEILTTGTSSDLLLNPGSGKVGINTSNTPDSSLEDVGSLHVTGNTRLDGNLSVGALISEDTIKANNVIPITDLGGSLGSPTKRYQTLYLGPNSLVMTGTSDQTTFSIDPDSGLTISTGTVVDTGTVLATTTISPSGTLNTSGVVTQAVTTALIMPDTTPGVISNIGAPGPPGAGGSFGTLYLGPNSLVMTGTSDQTTFSIDPDSGLTISTGTVVDTGTVLGNNDNIPLWYPETLRVLSPMPSTTASLLPDTTLSHFEYWSTWPLPARVVVLVRCISAQILW